MDKPKYDIEHFSQILQIIPCSGDWNVVVADDNGAPWYYLVKVAAWALIAEWSVRVLSGADMPDNAEVMPKTASRRVIPLCGGESELVDRVSKSEKFNYPVDMVFAVSDASEFTTDSASRWAEAALKHLSAQKAKVTN